MSDGDPNTLADGHRAEYDWSAVEPSTAVVEVVSAATGRRPADLDALLGTVDPDALDAVRR